MYQQLLHEELEKLREELGNEVFNARKFNQAGALFNQMTASPEFEEFLTLPGYKFL